jgi:hypothetical protein
MKRHVWSVGILLLSTGAIYAQESDTPKAEVGMTYSFAHRNNEQFTNGYNQNGGSGYFAVNLNRTVGLVADLGGYTGGPDRQTFTYLFGPRLNLRKSRFTPYVQFLFGGAYEWGVIHASGISTTQNGFAMAAGGGLDITISRHFAVKPFQVEYVMTQVPQLASNLNSAQNNLRYSAGIVYHFGSR